MFLDIQTLNMYHNLMFSPVSWGYKICWLHLCKDVRPPPTTTTTECPHTTLNCIWWYGSSLRALENVEYHFITITARSSPN